MANACPFDGNDLIPDATPHGWYYLHCPGCGNEFTVSGTHVGVSPAERFDLRRGDVTRE